MVVGGADGAACAPGAPGAGGGATKAGAVTDVPDAAAADMRSGGVDGIAAAGVASAARDSSGRLSSRPAACTGLDTAADGSGTGGTTRNTCPTSMTFGF